MIATINSLFTGRLPQLFQYKETQKAIIQRAFFAGCFWLAFSLGTVHAEIVPTNKVIATASFAVRAEREFKSAQARFRAEPKNSAAALKFGQSCFDWAEFADKNEQRERIALEGIVACRALIALQTQAAAGHYYLAMNLGQLAKTKTFGALKLVDEMEKEFQLARSLDEQFEHAGSDRNLGLLYAEAPGWPTSIGNRSKARHHLQRAVSLSADYPENRLNLLEAYLKWGDKEGAKHEFNAITEFWPTARKKFSGDKWESSWVDWEKRWEKLQNTFAESDRKLESPRQNK